MFKEKQLATGPRPETGQPSELLDSSRAYEQSDEARSIARLGDFGLIEQKLAGSGLFERERTRVQGQFSRFIESSDFPTKEAKLWDLFTILELYDPETAIHSVKTYQIAKEKVEKVLSRNIVLAKIIENEGVELERFYFACLNHDIGKVEIPHFIITNKTTKAQWNEKLEDCLEQKAFPAALLAKLGFDSETPPDSAEIEKRIRENCLSAEELLPVRQGLTENEILELEAKWGISADLSLMDIIDKHAAISAAILEKRNFPVAAEIVRNHHHKTTEVAYEVSVRSLQISSDMADILHLADVNQALASTRCYKESFTPIKTMGILIDHAEEGRIGREITYFWVKDEHEKLERQGLLENLGFAETKTLEKITEFLGQYESGDNKGSLDKWIEIHGCGKAPDGEKIELGQAA